ncbi:MAG: dephospho-CoA kinase, partial [bacterium]|nr:dephospho-CoA kinase [bacterium]
ANSAAREKINAIVHPQVIMVEQKILDKLARCGKFSAAGVEAALIYEAGSDQFFDVMLVVAASPETILNRLKKRDAFNPDQMRRRIAAQMELDEKIRRADYVIDNSGNLAELKTKVRKFVEWLHQQYAINNNDSNRI